MYKTTTTTACRTRTELHRQRRKSYWYQAVSCTAHHPSTTLQHTPWGHVANIHQPRTALLLATKMSVGARTANSVKYQIYDQFTAESQLYHIHRTAFRQMLIHSQNYSYTKYQIIDFKYNITEFSVNGTVTQFFLYCTLTVHGCTSAVDSVS